MEDPWRVKADSERDPWSFTPLKCVGPLRFGMSPAEVSAALGGATAGMHQGIPPQQSSDHFTEIGVTAYYVATELTCVAVDGRRGPQVILDGTPLTGRVPSAADDWIADYTQRQSMELRYTHEGNAVVPDLGLVMRVQRAGDAVVTRPLLTIREWTEVTWDSIPMDEWKTF
ncbi:hypothetical protein [Streptomyces sp. NPDC001536]|uniref:hypothetical protein n=1 Tax=Streptomyces sp. NPDC001536 TaxID=3364583 RepID=UPI0036CC4F26